MVTGGDRVWAGLVAEADRAQYLADMAVLLARERVASSHAVGKRRASLKAIVRRIDALDDSLASDLEDMLNLVIDDVTKAAAESAAETVYARCPLAVDGSDGGAGRNRRAS